MNLLFYENNFYGSFEYFRILVEDILIEDLLLYFDEFFKFIEDVFVGNGCVLVNCNVG